VKRQTRREDEAAIQLADGTRFLKQVQAACRGSTAARDRGAAGDEAAKPRKRPARARKAVTDAEGKVRSKQREGGL